MYIATAQLNEYKLGFEHSIVASEVELTRHLNFAFLTTVGNLSLAPIGYLLWLTYQEDEVSLGRRLLHFLPISLLFFSLSYWETLNWAMAGLQNIPIVLFSFLAIYLLASEKVFGIGRAYPLLACLAASLAAFTSANGFLLAPVGLLILLPRRAYTESLAWCASFIAPLAAYLYHYQHPVEPLYRAFYITRPLTFLAFFGGVVPFRWVAALLGLAALIVFFISGSLPLRSDQSHCVLLRRVDRGHGRPGRMGARRGGLPCRFTLRYLCQSVPGLLLRLSCPRSTRPPVCLRPKALLHHVRCHCCRYLFNDGPGRLPEACGAPPYGPVDLWVLSIPARIQHAPDQHSPWSGPKKGRSNRLY